VTPTLTSGSYQQSGGIFAVSGSGDIAPAVDVGSTPADILSGLFVGLIVVIVLGALFMTAEYRRGLIRTTLAASPRRGRVLAAKVLVLGSVTFAVGLVATTIAVPLGEHLLRVNGNYLYPVGVLSEVRVVAGTAALLALAAILALALGTVLRRSAGAIVAVIAAIVLPNVLVITAALPLAASQWLLRLTPAAGLAIQQTLTAYPQVDYAYSPARGYFPLAPWAGFAVLCAYAALALGLAVVLLRRRDA
jgi:ABC-type transport system involved in multi-copper enzyme maturation permease subunit